MNFRIKLISLFIVTLFMSFFTIKSAFADTFTLSGTVTDGSNTPIANTVITTVDTTSGNTVGTTTNDPTTGNYSLVLPQGTYNITATPPSSSGFQSVTQSNQTISGDTTLNFTLVSQVQFYTVNGHITDKAGSPVVGAQIYVDLDINGTGTPVATTDSNGDYSFQVRSGPHTFGIRGTSLASDLPQIVNVNLANAMNITQDTTFDMQLPMNSVSVHVQDQAQNAIVNSHVSAGNPSGPLGNIVSIQTSLGALQFNSQSSSSGFTDNAGNVILNVFPGNTTAFATSPNTQLYQSASVTQVINQDGQLVTVTLPPAIVLYTVNGHITDKLGSPVVGANIFVDRDMNGSATPVATTDSNGDYSFQVQPGSHIFGVRGTSLASDLPQIVNVNLATAVNINQNTTFNMQLPTNSVNVHVQNQAQTAIVNSHVSAGNPGGPLGGIVLIQTSLGTLQFNSQSSSSGFTDNAGNVTLNVFPGNTTAFATSPNTQLYQSASITTTVNQDGQLINVTLPPAIVNYTVSGHITDKAGSLVVGANIFVDRDMNGSATPVATTDENGYYSFQVQSGSHIFGIRGSDLASDLPQIVNVNLATAVNINQNTTFNMQLPTNSVNVHVQNQAQTAVVNSHVFAGNPGGPLGGRVSIQTSLGALQFNSQSSSSGFTDNAGNVALNVFPGNTTISAVVPNNNIYVSYSTTIPVTNDLFQVISLQYSHAMPTTTANLTTQYADGAYTDPTTVTLSATAASGFSVANTYYTIDGSSPTAYTTPFTVAGAGSHNITYWSVDNSGVTEVHNTKTFIITEVHSLTGTVYLDSNQNGVQDTGENGYQGATVTLNTGQTTTTDSNGNYTFSNIEARTYVETVTLPNGYFATTTNPVNIALGADTTQNFGIAVIPTHTLSGTVYNDDNQNGLQDTSENGYQGATVTLNSGQTVISTATTDANGNYSIPNIQPGTYTETLTVPTGYTATTTNPVSIPVTADTTQNFGIFSNPIVGTITATPNPVKINTTLSANATFTEGNTSDTHTASWNWGDGHTSTGVVTENSGSGSVANTHSYTALGSYTVTLTVTNNNGASSTSQLVISVIPTGGLQGGNLSHITYSGADLSNQNISNANLSVGTFTNDNFSGANLSQVNGSNSTFTNDNFTGANLNKVNMSNSNLSNSNFTNAILTQANLSNANLTNANFTGANLTGANLSGAIKTGIIWSNTICPNGQNSNNHNNSCAGQGGGL